MEDGKKRGRAAAPKPADGNDSGGETASPRKRGRPSKAEKVKKAPSGRGRGRPAKNPSAKADSDDAAVNGAGDGATAGSGAGRGRPPKKGKVSTPYEPTGKARGRPKNPPKSDHEDEEEGDDDDDDGGDGGDDDDDDENKNGTVAAGSKQKLAGKSSGSAKVPKKRGRPQKPVDSDDLDEDSEEGDDGDKTPQESKPLGRPPTGATRLNIVATGRGQGRPKKAAVSETEAKIRGRKPGNKAEVKAPSGRPRGRPATAAPSSGSQDDQDSLSEKEDSPQPKIANGKNKDAADVSDASNDEEDVVELDIPIDLVAA